MLGDYVSRSELSHYTLYQMHGLLRRPQKPYSKNGKICEGAYPTGVFPA